MLRRRHLPPGRARTAPLRRLIRLAVVLFATVIAAQCVLFVAPAGDAPRHVDAVVVLGGPGPRVERGEELARRGFADELVLAIGGSAACTDDLPVRLACFRPEPNTTRGEARRVAELAREHGWRDLMVVVQNEQAFRASLRLRRCLEDDVSITFVTVRGSLLESVLRTQYESVALLKAVVLQRGC